MVSIELNRRRFLRGAVAVGAVGLAGAALRSPSVVQASALAMEQEAKRHFAPVKVARNRIIREVVGLRPYRAEGFVVGAERLGDKLLVHNYGHGGAGVTLSWGTSALAVDIARDFVQTGVMPPAVRTNQARTLTPLPATHPLPQAVLTNPTHSLPQVLTVNQNRVARRFPRRFAVLGCGVMGLSTARLLQRRLLGEGSSVTIYAKDVPPQTTSNIAGALWLPTSSYDPQIAGAKFLEQFHLACRLSNRAFQELVGVEYGVRWIDTYELTSREAAIDRELTGGAALYPQTEIHRNADEYFGFPYVRQFSTMMIEPHTYLRALLRDFYLAGGKVVVKDFKNREEVARLSEPVIFNCTGLGARDLFGDEKLGPVRGQLEVLLPQPEIDYCLLSGSSYMFPRRDGIILGGTFNHDDWSLEPNAEQTTAILEAHAGIMKGLTHSN